MRKKSEDGWKKSLKESKANRSYKAVLEELKKETPLNEKERLLQARRSKTTLRLYTNTSDEKKTFKGWSHRATHQDIEEELIKSIKKKKKKKEYKN